MMRLQKATGPVSENPAMGSNMRKRSKKYKISHDQVKEILKETTL